MNKYLDYFQLAAKEASKSLCDRAKCGAVVVDVAGAVIGKGYNAPPLEDESQRFCNLDLNSSIKAKYDTTCCVHAEWNAVLDACKSSPSQLEGSTLYFMRIDKNGNFTDAGEPYCTVCSRLTLQSGVAHFALWVDKDIKLYSTKDYNLESYKFFA